MVIGLKQLIWWYSTLNIKKFYKLHFFTINLKNTRTRTGQSESFEHGYDNHFSLNNYKSERKNLPSIKKHWWLKRKYIMVMR